jgi:hypothetical protein
MTQHRQTARANVRERWLRGVAELTCAEVVLLFDLRLVVDADPRRDTLSRLSARCAVRVDAEAVHLRCLNRAWFTQLLREQRVFDAVEAALQSAV